MIGPYQVVSTGPADTPFCVVNVDTGNTIHVAYHQGWAGYSADRVQAARMAAVWNRCWMEDQATETADVDGVAYGEGFEPRGDQ